jgi:hypothetical protein
MLLGPNDYTQQSGLEAYGGKTSYDKSVMLDEVYEADTSVHSLFAILELHSRKGPPSSTGVYRRDDTVQELEDMIRDAYSTLSLGRFVMQESDGSQRQDPVSRERAIDSVDLLN